LVLRAWHKQDEMPSQSTLLGAAGEHHVMAELLRRGYIAALAPQGVPNADIVVTDIEGSQLCSLQVKTRRDIGSDGGWHMKAKHERLRGNRLFYCFVDFGRSVETPPLLYLLPSATVADVLGKAHSRWLAAPGKNGQPHKDTEMRRLVPDYTRVFGPKNNPYPRGWLDQYRDAWHLLQLDPAPEPEKVDGGQSR
jgi:hypothetical protein